MESCSIRFTVVLCAAAAALVVNPCLAQPASGPGANQAFHVPGKPAITTPSIVLNRGTTLVAEFSNGLNVTKLKPGDKVKAMLTQDLIVRGKIVAKVDSKLIGHVTEVKRHTEQDPRSVLGVVFDKVLLKHHQELAFQAVVQALAPPAPRRSRVDEPDQMMPPPVLGQNSNSAVGRNSGTGRGASGGGAVLSSAAASLNSIGATPTVRSTPGINPGNSMGGAPETTSAGNKPLSGGLGLRGVYGIKDLNLALPADPASPVTLIVSSKGNVKLEGGTQVVLVVTGEGR